MGKNKKKKRQKKTLMDCYFFSPKVAVRMDIINNRVGILFFLLLFVIILTKSYRVFIGNVVLPSGILNNID